MASCIFCSEVTSDISSHLSSLEILGMIDVIDKELRYQLGNSITTPVCNSCVALMRNSYNFKVLCETTETKLMKYMNENCLSKGDMDLVSLFENEIRKDKPVCRICLQKIFDNQFLSANGKLVGVECEIKEMLEVCSPQINLFLTNEPTICKSCVEMLIMSFAFHNKCLFLKNKFNINGEVPFNSIMNKKNTNIIHQIDENSSFGTTELREIKVEDSISDTTDGNLMDMGPSVFNNSCPFRENTDGLFNTIYIKQESDSPELNEEIKLEENEELLTQKKCKGNINFGKTYKPVSKYYFCKTCTYTTKRKACLIKHKVVHLPGYEKPIFKCGECGYTVKQQKYLDIHMAQHAKGVDFKKYKCPFCSFCARKKCKLERHLTVHKDERETTMYRCSKCMFVTKWKEYLSQHELIHNLPEEAKKFRCDKCNFSTNWKGSLIQHEVVHLSGEEAFKFHCTQCPYKTKRKDNLTKHMIRHMKDEDARIFYCPECPFTSKFSSKLSRHLHVHKKRDELTIYKCNVCSFETRWKNNLSQHMRVHQDASEIDLFKCNDCSFTTKWKTCLTEHVVMHKTGENSKEFKCEHCDFNTKWRKSLNMHLLTHSTDDAMKKFKCTVCDYKTYRSHHLKRHLQVHSK